MWSFWLSLSITTTLMTAIKYQMPLIRCNHGCQTSFCNYRMAPIVWSLANGERQRSFLHWWWFAIIFVIVGLLLQLLLDRRQWSCGSQYYSIVVCMLSNLSHTGHHYSSTTAHLPPPQLLLSSLDNHTPSTTAHLPSCNVSTTAHLPPLQVLITLIPDPPCSLPSKIYPVSDPSPHPTFLPTRTSIILHHTSFILHFKLIKKFDFY